VSRTLPAPMLDAASDLYAAITAEIKEKKENE
jgi:hypothetical protein